MAPTPKHALPKPLGSAPADVPFDIGALADKLDLIMTEAMVGTRAARPATSQNGVLYYATDDGTVWLANGSGGWLQLLTPNTLIVGEMRFMARATAPALWLPCDFAERSRTTYANLWNVIREGHAGTAGDPAPWGNGDGVNTFNVPDMRGRSPVGAGQAVGGGIEASPPNRVMGTKWGVNAVVLSVAQIPAHAHPISDPGHLHYITGYPLEGAELAVRNDAAASPGASATQPAVTGITVQNTGGGGSHENAPPSVAVPAYVYAGV